MGRRSDHSRDELHELALQATREIVQEEGLERLTIRRIAGRMGYTHGTLYNLFDDLDAIILQINGRTLDALYDRVRKVPLEGEPEESLLALANAYFAFVRDNSKLWNLLFEHHLPGYAPLPEWHHEKLGRLLGLVEDCLAPLYRPEEETDKKQTARILWSSLHGMTTLETQRKLIPGDTIEGMVASLVETYLRGLRNRPDAIG